MYILAFETTGPAASVALIDENRRIRTINGEGTLAHLSSLMPMTKQLLEEEGITPDQIDCIAASQGPGSFTGIRIGISSARAMGQALGKPVIAVPTLESFIYAFECQEASEHDDTAGHEATADLHASSESQGSTDFQETAGHQDASGLQGNSSVQKRIFCPMLDARRKQVYGGAYIYENGGAFDYENSGAGALLYESSPDAVRKNNESQNSSEHPRIQTVLPGAPYNVSDYIELALQIAKERERSGREHAPVEVIFFGDGADKYRELIDQAAAGSAEPDTSRKTDRSDTGSAEPDTSRSTDLSDTYTNDLANGTVDSPADHDDMDRDDDRANDKVEIPASCDNKDCANDREINREIKITVADEGIRHQSAAYVACYALDMYRQGKVLGYNDLKPDYMRKPEAQRRAEEKDAREIRDGRPEDAGKLARIDDVCFGSEAWSRESFEKDLSDPEERIYKVAEAGKTVAGYAGAWIVAGEGHITNIAVLPRFRRRGLARKLVLAMIEEGRKRGAADFTLEVRASNNGAIALYRGLGFKKEGVRKKYYSDNGEDAVIMWLRSEKKAAAGRER